MPIPPTPSEALYGEPDPTKVLFQVFWYFTAVVVYSLIMMGIGVMYERHIFSADTPNKTTRSPCHRP